MSGPFAIESGVTLTGVVRGTGILSGAISPSNNISGSLQITRGIEDHRLLTNRDSPDQHPISAITSLAAELDSKVEADDVLSNIDIDNILRRFV